MDVVVDRTKVRQVVGGSEHPQEKCFAPKITKLPRENKAANTGRGQCASRGRRTSCIKTPREQKCKWKMRRAYGRGTGGGVGWDVDKGETCHQRCKILMHWSDVSPRDSVACNCDGPQLAASPRNAHSRAIPISKCPPAVGKKTCKSSTKIA